MLRDRMGPDEPGGARCRLQQHRRGEEQRHAERRAHCRLRRIPGGVAGLPGRALWPGGAAALGHLPRRRPGRALFRVHPWRLLATQHAGAVHLFGRRVAGAWLVGGAARLHTGARCDDDGDQRRDCRRTGLARRARRRARRHRPRGPVRVVGRRASDGDGARPSARDRRARHLRPVRTGADPRHLSQPGAAIDRRGDRRPVTHAAAGCRQANGDRLRHGRTAAAGGR